jgi:hypothetical protein
MTRKLRRQAEGRHARRESNQANLRAGSMLTSLLKVPLNPLALLALALF